MGVMTKKAKRVLGSRTNGRSRQAGDGEAGSGAQVRPGNRMDPARYADVFDLAPVGYAILSGRGVIEAINPLGARLLGRSQMRLMGKRFATFSSRISRDSLNRSLGKALAGAGRQICDIETDPRAGAALHLRVWSSAVRRSPPTVLVMFDDIMGEKAHEEQLLRAATTAAQSLRRKDEFLAVLSHALRGSLAPIRNCLFLLGRVTPSGDQAGKAKTIIDRGVRHLTRLVDDLLTLTRTTRGQLRLKRAQVDFCQVVHEAIERQRRSCEEKGIGIVTSGATESLWVYADSTRLSDVVSTLLRNMERFTPEGGRIVVSVDRSGGRAELRMSAQMMTGEPDSPPETRRTSSESFVLASEAIERASAGGLGHGLAMLKGELELHGGSVNVETDMHGRGRAISLWLPLEDPPSLEAVAPRPTRARRRKVLVIEDIPDAADTLRDALRLVGHDVDVAYDGPSGLEQARRFRPAIVICDIELPGMDGYQVARSLRAEEDLRETYLVALTGYAGPEDLDRAKSAGFNEHLAKPATMEALQSLLDNAPLTAREVRPDAKS